MKKFLYIIAVIVILLILLATFSSSGGKSTKNGLKIGVLLPLSGPVAEYGEQIHDGMEIAISELNAKGAHTEAFYEDNKADPVAALSAYRKLIDVDHVDYVVSSMTRATLPLIGLVKQDKVPMIMTLVAGDWDKSQAKDVLRFYVTASQYVRGDNADKVLNGVHSIGIIYVNDAYGQSTLKALQDFATEKGFKVVLAEGYLPNSQDYRLSLSKLKNSGVDLIAMISSSATELSAISKQYKELGITQKLFDASTGLSNPNVRLNNKDVLEGVVTKATQAELPGKNTAAASFFDRFNQLYKKDPYFPAIFGYESIKLIADIDSEKGQDFTEKASSLKSISTIMGDITISDYQEINPPIYNAVIKNGQLVEF